MDKIEGPVFEIRREPLMPWQDGQQAVFQAGHAEYTIDGSVVSEREFLERLIIAYEGTRFDDPGGVVEEARARLRGMGQA